jgi:hypothetical protein
MLNANIKLEINKIEILSNQERVLKEKMLQYLKEGKE